MPQNPADSTVAPSNPTASTMRWPQYRSRHRMRNHHEAHAEACDAAPPAVLDHELVPASEPELIDSDAALSDLIADLRDAGQFGYDSEFIGEHTFYPHICLIQVATADRIALIDPLAGVGLMPFWELLADASVEKIVHAGVQDLEPVLRTVGKPPQNIFDTQIASAFVGQPYPRALARLVEDLLDGDLGAGVKFSQWDHRPLTAAQMQYAANDVRYLLLLRQELDVQLRETGNLDWAMAELQTLNERELYTFDPRAQRIKARGASRLSGRKRAILLALMDWRAQAAQQQNVPTRVMLSDPVLCQLATNPVTSESDLGSVRGLPRPVRHHYGRAIIATIEKALRDPLPAEAKRKRSIDLEPHKSLVDETWAAVEARCEQRGIAPGIVASKKEVAKFVVGQTIGRPQTHSRLNDGWRAALLGNLLTP